MEREEESEKLKVVREDSGFDLMTVNTSSCVFKNVIYAFKTRNYEEVHRYSLESGKWLRFYPAQWPWLLLMLLSFVLPPSNFKFLIIIAINI